ncbi:MAG TPA: glycosyltransferase family 39 protein [Candidatus Binataceae bacterium]|nr:glycosyltransferase family 39 protein [Candidatus Binataceae bacterium]
MVAVLLGAHYRFHRLSHWDMDGDEGAAWIAAVAPNVRAVAGTFSQVEYGGKLPIYDLVLHEWVRVFGESLFAMRAMSAALGTIAIVLLFFAVREIYRALGGEACAEGGEVAGAFAALIYAANRALVISDRRAREFPLLMVVELLQIIFFMRAQRRDASKDYLGLAISTAIMLPINYCASFLLLAEALWLGCLLVAKWAGSMRARQLAMFRPGFAVLAGMALLAPFAPSAYVSSRDAVAAGAVDFIKQKPVTWPFTLLSRMVGTPALFWVVVILIGLGVWRQSRSARLVPGFLAIWTAGPVFAAFAVTYLVRPIELPRYVFIAFVGMFAFAGFGAASVRRTAVRIAFATVIVSLSVPTIDGLIRVSPNAAWREATALAIKQCPPGEKIAVLLPYNLQVVRFYMPPERRSAVVGMETKCGPAPVLMLSDRSFAPPEQIAAAEACYPRVLARLQLVEVRAR